MGYTFPPQFEIEIEKLNLDGAGVGFYNGRRVAIFGAMSGDTVLAKPLKVSRNHSKAQLIEVIKKAEGRKEVGDIHYPSSSPWLPMPYEKQLQQKEIYLQKIFKEKSGEEQVFNVEPSVLDKAYRTKVEFGFFENKSGEIALGFRKRNRWRDFYEINQLTIAPPVMLEVAKEILSKINENQISIDQLKSLVVRYSFSEKKCIAGLFVTDRHVKSISPKQDNLNGFHIVYSDPLSPVSKITDVIATSGEELMTDIIHGKTFRYHWNGFFQQNVPTFEKLLEFVSAHVPKSGTFVDLYSGVGTIGISLAEDQRKIVAIESDTEASELSKKNAEINSVQNYTHTSSCIEAEDLGQFISKEDAVILDPPRAGLHPSVVRYFVENGPERLIYISCNPKTQAINYVELKKTYIIEATHAFDLYPHTPHVESVLILKRKQNGIRKTNIQTD